MDLSRRRFNRLLLSAPLLALGSCRGHDERYTEEDAARLEQQWAEEKVRSGTGPFGPQRYQGYRGLADLPYFELQDGRVRCIVEDLPPVFDVHAHLGMALLFAPRIDLLARTDRVRHLLDCDAEEPCELDLDVYMNANFTPDMMRSLRWQAISQFTWGSSSAETHTIPNLLVEMDDARVERAFARRQFDW